MHSTGGQKRCCNNVVAHDLNECDLLPDWYDLAHNRGPWQCLMKGEGEKMELCNKIESVKKEMSYEQTRKTKGAPQPAQDTQTH